MDDADNDIFISVSPTITGQDLIGIAQCLKDAAIFFDSETEEETGLFRPGVKIWTENDVLMGRVGTTQIEICTPGKTSSVFAQIAEKINANGFMFDGFEIFADSSAYAI